MKVNKGLCLSVIICVFMASGCVVRTYSITKERADQDLSIGNRGYLSGQMPPAGTKERKTTRTIQAVEIELHTPIRFERISKQKSKPQIPKEKEEDSQLWGNRGYVTESYISEETAPESSLKEIYRERYIVQKNDTLQKIAKKFYGTTKKWTKIYEANKDVLKAPDKIYPGQTIEIPLDQKSQSRQEIPDNLK